MFCPQIKLRWDHPCAIILAHRTQSWTSFDLADFFLVRAASLFTLRTFGAQIYWRVISRKILFAPQRFLSNKSPICWRERKRKYVSQKQMACSKEKWRSIATVPDLRPTTVKILTHLISRYHLPLIWLICYGSSLGSNPDIAQKCKMGEKAKEWSTHSSPPINIQKYICCLYFFIIFLRYWGLIFLQYLLQHCYPLPQIQDIHVLFVQYTV